MARPKTKAELLDAATTQFSTLWQLIDSMSAEEREAPFAFGDDPNDKEAHWKRDKNLRDIFVHLYEWHQLLITWITSNKNCVAQPFLPEPYNWKTYGNMNVEFWRKHQNTSYTDAEAMLRTSHAEVLALIESFTNEELFEKAHFSWTGTTNLGSYCVSATSSHYDWAIKKIKRQVKLLRQ